MDPFMVIHPALHADAVIDRPEAPAAMLLRLFFENLAQGGIIPAFGLIVVARRRQFQQPAASAQADIVGLPQIIGRLALLSGLYQFFELMSLSIWISSA
jgi:hypothetical protein